MTSLASASFTAPRAKAPAASPPPKDRLSEGLTLLIDTIGVDATVDFILAFGGQSLWPYVRTPPEKIAAVIGEEKAKAFCHYLGGELFRVPTSRQWLARQLSGRGWTKADICTRLLCTREALRLFLRPGPIKARGGRRGRPL